MFLSQCIEGHTPPVLHNYAHTLQIHCVLVVSAKQHVEQLCVGIPAAFVHRPGTTHIEDVDLVFHHVSINNYKTKTNMSIYVAKMQLNLCVHKSL